MKRQRNFFQCLVTLLCFLGVQSGLTNNGQDFLLSSNELSNQQSEIEEESAVEVVDSPAPRPVQFRPDYTYHVPTATFYKFHKEPTTWRYAKIICEQEGATLFYPRTKEELDFTTNVTNGSHTIFLGIHDIFYERLFTSVDGQPVSELYIKWSTGEPSDRGGDKSCVLSTRNLMSSVNCASTTSPFVCHRRQSTTPYVEECKTYDAEYTWHKKFEKCYKFHLKPKTWSQAYRVCIVEGSRLAIVESPDKAKLLQSYLGRYPKSPARNYAKNYLLAGFHDLFGEGVFRTIDDRNMEENGFARWAQGHPFDSSNTQCGAVDSNGNLVDVDCSKKALFLCERDVKNLAYPDAYSVNEDRASTVVVDYAEMKPPVTGPS